MLLLLTIAGCTGKGAPTDLVVVSKYADKEIKVDGLADESVWKEASTTVIPTKGGPDVKVKSFYNDKKINFYISWPDSTKDDVSKVWEFDGTSWKNDPDQDKLAILWDKGNSVAYFDIKGCGATCHTENEDKDLWYMATNSRKEKTDLWFWLAGISNPLKYVSDRFLDDTVDPTLSKAARKQDKGEVGFLKNGYKTPVERIAPSRPTLKLIKPLTVQNRPYPLSGEMEDITFYKDFKAGDREPFVYFNGPPTESQADIKGQAVWQDGRWYLEMSRKLDTTYKDDMPFAPESGASVYYMFGLMVSNHTEPPPIKHSTSGPVTLEMAPKP
ncbi:MAG: ethylbenzene dehydrogenase-related protein [Actinomycetota bacterium]